MRLFDKINEKYEQKLYRKEMDKQFMGHCKDVYEIADRYEMVFRKLAKRMGHKDGQKILEDYRRNRILYRCINDEYVIGLIYTVKDEKGKPAYYIYDYFLCDKNVKDINAFNTIKLTQISGDDFGAEFELIKSFIPDGSNYHLEVEFREGEFYHGQSSAKVYIPKSCRDIIDLKEYADSQNAMRKQIYEKKCATIAKNTQKNL
jgi:hypothetical protein